MELRLAVSALEDVHEIRRYYHDQGVPEIGERLLLEVMGHIEHLADHPGMGRVVPEFGTANLREIIHPPFRIVYWREPACVNIIRVWRAERQLRLPGP